MFVMVIRAKRNNEKDSQEPLAVSKEGIFLLSGKRLAVSGQRVYSSVLTSNLLSKGENDV